jgi:uncharacterized protein
MNRSQKAGVALITGASSGIGYEYARILAGMGFGLVLVSNEAEKLEEIRHAFSAQFQVEVRVFCMDLALHSAAQELFELCKTHNMAVDILINNAGLFFFGEVVESDPEKALKMITLHVATTSLLCRYFGKEMKARRFGYILNMSSMSACMAYPGIAYYSASKRYIRSFSRALRTEMADYNVSVTAVCPGAVATNLFDRNVVDYKKAMRYGIMMRPEIVAQIALRAMFRRKAVSTPGFINRLITFLVRITPHGVILFIKRNTRLIPGQE